MGKLSKTELAWWEAIPHDQIFTCRDCGKEGTKASVQPQYRKDHALCVQCIGRINREWRESRKLARRAAARCEVASCNRGGTWRVAGVLLCGPCKNRALAEANNMGVCGLLAAPTLTRQDILAMASGKEESRLETN